MSGRRKCGRVENVIPAGMEGSKNVPIARGRLIMKPVKGDLVRFVAIMLNALIAVPLFTLTNLYLYVLRARILLGHWPSPGNPPYPVGSDFQAILVPIGAVASVVSLIGAAIVILWLMLSRRRWALVSRPVMRRLLVFVVVWVVFFLLFRLDPGQFVAWIWD